MAANGDILPGTYTAYDKGTKLPNPLTLVYEGTPTFSVSIDILKQEAIIALEDTYRAEGRIEELRQMRLQ